MDVDVGVRFRFARRVSWMPGAEGAPFEVGAWFEGAEVVRFVVVVGWEGEGVIRRDFC